MMQRSSSVDYSRRDRFAGLRQSGTGHVVARAYVLRVSLVSYETLGSALGMTLHHASSDYPHFDGLYFAGT